MTQTSSDQTRAATAERPDGDTLVVDDAAIPTERVSAMVVVDGITPAAAEDLRRHVEEAAGGGNRFVWFLFGFVAALLAGVISAVVFLAVSDEDDDGDLELDVPSVEVDIGS